MKDSQNLRILRHLAKGRTLTTMQAITKFGCTRLAARIADLRKSWPIETKWQSRNGKRWAVYSLANFYCPLAAVAIKEAAQQREGAT